MKLNKCYQLFELVPGASLTDMKAAYRQLARLVHPDLHPTYHYAQKRFVVLNQAYKVLQDFVSTDHLLLSFDDALDQNPAATSTTFSPLSAPGNDLKWRAIASYKIYYNVVS